MRIVIAACPTIPVPPIDYGGTERQIDILARGLTARGHTITLLCGPGSTCPVRKIVASSKFTDAEWEYVSWLREHRAEWDVLFDATRFHYPSHVFGLPLGSPTVAGMFGDPYKLYPHDGVRNRMYCSPQIATHFNCPNYPVLHNVVYDNPLSIPLGDGRGGYALYVGAIRPEKGVHIAAAACHRLGITLKVAGQVQPKFSSYWESFCGSVNFVGPVGGDAKWRLFAEAACFVLPVNWCDAGPLTISESLLVGTPVVACPIGGLLEDVRDGENGALVSRKNFAVGLDRVMNYGWDRRAIRAGILPSIDPDRWIDGVLALLRAVAAGKSW